MTANIIDGNILAAKIIQNLAQTIQNRRNKNLRLPGLALIIVGDDPSSQIYVNKKHQTCKTLGIISKNYHLPRDISEVELLKLIATLNTDAIIDGILLQMPIPEHINANNVIEHISPDKDVDGFHPHNLGQMMIGNPILRSCTPKGIMTLLNSIVGIHDFRGMHAVIIGASTIVGKPMAMELLRANCTVTICHRYTKDITQHIKQADILITAVGQPNLIKGSWIKPNAIVIDVGISRLPNGKVIGDVEFITAKEHASWITPVPGGVGPMTVASLMENTVYAATELHRE